MDSGNFIKMEEQSPIHSTSNIMGFCMPNLFDDDSIMEPLGIKQELQQNTIVDYNYIIGCVEQVYNIRTTPLNEIFVEIQNMFPNLSESDLEHLRKIILKNKSILKRSHAKNRDKGQKSIKEYTVTDHSVEQIAHEDIQAELKKKRNRMSAQISRDRKKIKIQELENDNSKLRQETEKIRLENEKLKQQLQAFNSSQNKRQDSKPQRNKFISFLVMLGLLCLFSIFKDSRSGQDYKALISVDKSKNQIFTAKDQNDIIEQSQKAFRELNEAEDDFRNDSKALGLIISKLQGLKLESQAVVLPKSLKKKIEAVQAQFL